MRLGAVEKGAAAGHNGIAPYPETANWQKALGAHFIWVSGDIVVSANQRAR
jgi:hypothetical protein